MTNEESIEILKNSKNLYLKEKIDSDILEVAIETLLTAYEKEKEKNDYARLEKEALLESCISKDELIELREIDNIDLIQCKLRKLLEE